MILHLCTVNKFIEPFYEFVKNNFDDFDSNHQFYIEGLSEKYINPVGNNIFFAQKVKSTNRYVWLTKQMNQADKIILHGLWDMRALMLLCLQPWLLKKCYWVIWGGDLYTHKPAKKTRRWWRNEILRRFAIKRFGHFITHIRGDYELAKQWYAAQGVWHECFMYPSNLYYESSKTETQHDGINILLGNSADPSNNHIEVLEKLSSYVTDEIHIFCPLSYGDAEYAKKVADYGKRIFNDKFNPLFEFMSFNDYKNLLSTIDIAIFNHKRQQGMGNITTLLGMGKKVYLQNNTTSWQFLNEIGLKIYSIDSFNCIKLDSESVAQNQKTIQNYFSTIKLKNQLNTIFK
ncbi:TDP-N-acetylfucosamine:lipid II N-acetylfucosaminyltransferase [Limnobacter sp.]